jgi:hypothetical protein
MGTRSSYMVIDMVSYKDIDGKPATKERKVANIYVHYDGYPEGHPSEVAKFLAGGKLVNGIPLGEDVHYFNGAGDVASQVNCFLRTMDGNDFKKAGGVYINPIEDHGFSWENYTYEIVCDTQNGQITFRCPQIDFNADPANFGKFIKNRKEK